MQRNRIHMNMLSFEKGLLISALLLSLLCFPADSVGRDSDASTIEKSRENGGQVFYIPAEFEYHRFPQKLWESRFRRLAFLGFNSVITSVPYSYQMPEGKSFRPEALESFLALCRSLNVPVIIHPGHPPDMEWNVGGVLPPGKSCFRHSGHYDPRYWRQVKAWYDQLIPVLLPYLESRGGPVSAITLLPMNDDLPDSESREMLAHSRDFLAAEGIDVPIIIDKAQEEELPTIFESGVYSGRIFDQSGLAPFIRNFESSISRVSLAAKADTCSYPLLRDGEFSEDTFSVRLWNSFFTLFGRRLAKAGTPVPDLFIVNRYPPDISIDIANWHVSLLSGIAWNEPWFNSPLPPADWSELRESANITSLYPGSHGMYAAFHALVNIVDAELTSPLYMNLQGLSGNIFLFINGELAGKAYNIFSNSSIPCQGVFKKGKNIVVIVNEMLPGRRNGAQIPDEINLRTSITSGIAYRSPVRISGQRREMEINIFFENTATTPQLFKFAYSDRNQEERRIVPSGNYLRIEPHERRIFPVNFSIQDVGFNYVTSHIFGVAGSEENPILILWDREGTSGEISISSNVLPKIGGIESYSWNKKQGEILINYRHEGIAAILSIDRLAIQIITEEQASSTWLVETPLGIIPIFWDRGIPEKLTAGSDAWNFDFILMPGERQAKIAPVPRPRRISLDSLETPFAYDAERKEISFFLHVPQYEKRDVEFLAVPSSADHTLLTADIDNELAATGFYDAGNGDHGNLRFYHIPMPINKTEKISPQILLTFNQPVWGALIVNDSFSGIFTESLSMRGIHLPGGILSEKPENSITVICRQEDMKDVTLSGGFRTNAAQQRSRHRLEIFW